MVYLSFFDIIGNFDVDNILKFKNQIVIVTTKKTYKNILEKLKNSNIKLIITDNFKTIKKRVKKNKKYKLISAEVVSDRSIFRDIE